MKAKKVLKVIGIIVLILVVILIAVVSAGYIYLNQKMGKMQTVDIDEEELGISEQVEGNLSEYRNIAIFGVDSRGDNYQTGNRSDCIIIASLNNKTGEIKLISVYRDTYVNIEGHGLDKITHAYSYGSAQLALKTLNTNLDLNIKEFVAVNFEAVAEVVDELGGIEINIESNEIEYLNGYISETSSVTGKTTKKITKAGKQTLDGVQAVCYSRIRYTAGGDYKRTERMRTVIAAMFEKIKTKNIGEINKLIDNLLPMVYTNITTNDIISLLPNIAKYNIGTSIGWPYETRGITLNSWYGVPVTLESNVVQMHKEAFGEEDYVVSNTVKSISEQIIKKTGYDK